MSLSLDEVRALCTKSELELVAGSRSPAIEKLSAVQLKKNVANVRKLTEKWQKLSRGQSRNESQKSGEPNLDSRSYAKHQLFQESLAAYEAQLAKATSPVTVAGGSQAASPQATSNKPTGKQPTAKQRTSSAKVSRQAVKKELNSVKKGLNKAATATVAPAAAAKVAKTTATVASVSPPAKSKAVVSKPAAKAAATKKNLVKSADKRAKKRATLASSSSIPAPAKKKVAKVTVKSGIVVPTAAAQAELAGKAKANRMKLSNLSSNIAGHVSGAGKRRQAKRDAKGR